MVCYRFNIGFDIMSKQKYIDAKRLLKTFFNDVLKLGIIFCLGGWGLLLLLKSYRTNPFFYLLIFLICFGVSFIICFIRKDNKKPEFKGDI